MVNVLVVALAASASLTVQAREDCRYEARRDATVRVSARDVLDLVARSGDLRVEGRSGTSQITITGRACAATQDLLDQLVIETERSGSTVHVEVPQIDQDMDWGNGRYARLDLEIVIPLGMAAKVQDGSGDLTIEGAGDLELTDGSGSITLRNIGGRLTIEDGSGEIDIQQVAGLVTIRDGSGSITVSDVDGDVRVPLDGSGNIEVERVRGDLTVAVKGSGSIRHSGVRGTIDVPERDRRRRRIR